MSTVSTALSDASGFLAAGLAVFRAKASGDDGSGFGVRKGIGDTLRSIVIQSPRFNQPPADALRRGYAALRRFGTHTA